jgi:hypothetical protein
MNLDLPLAGWGSHLLTKFVRQIEFYSAAFSDRIFPAFDTIESESEAHMNRLYQELGRMPYDDSIDMSDVAEWAQEQGVEYYESLSGVRQSIIGIALAGLYHLLEQQIGFFLRKEVLDSWEVNEMSIIPTKELSDRLASKGIVVPDLPSWPRIDQLRLIANAIKHGEGRSVEQLRTIRPDLFEEPQFRGDSMFASIAVPVLLPLAGEDFFPTTDDFSTYVEAARGFWSELLARYFAA